MSNATVTGRSDKCCAMSKFNFDRLGNSKAANLTSQKFETLNYHIVTTPFREWDSVVGKGTLSDEHDMR